MQICRSVELADGKSYSLLLRTSVDWIQLLGEESTLSINVYNMSKPILGNLLVIKYECGHILCAIFHEVRINIVPDIMLFNPCVL